MPHPSAPRLPDGVVAFVKRDCPTCELVAPVLVDLAGRTQLTIYSQDDPAFPPRLAVVDDTALEMSWHHQIEAVPTLIRVEAGKETVRALGWHRGDWEALTGESGLGPDLPELRPGCGSLSVDPDREAGLRVRFGGSVLSARRIEVASAEDEMETAFARGWSDGLPVVPPTEERVLTMLTGTLRAPSEIVAEVPPDLAPCTVEKVAINAVMAGCKPENLPVVLTALEAACTDEFNIHGVLATTMGAAPVVIVNGPIRRAIGMNSGIGVLGSGNRANMTIGRALNLVLRNIGGARPGGVDRSTFGQPAKLGFAFPEDEEASPWTPICADFGVDASTDAVTLFCGSGSTLVVDQLSREPESLARSFATTLRAVLNPKLVMAFDCMLVVGPEHGRVFAQAGWSKADLKKRLLELLQIDGKEVVRGAGGIAEGMPEQVADTTVPKFLPDAIHIAFAGSGAGLFSTIIPGWVRGQVGSVPVAKEIRS